MATSIETHSASSGHGSGQAPRPAYTGTCRGCGTVVWSAQDRTGLPGYRETVLCPNCGRDCSRRPFPGYHLWRLRRGVRLGRKRLWLLRWRLRYQWVPDVWERLARRIGTWL